MQRNILAESVWVRRSGSFTPHLRWTYHAYSMFLFPLLYRNMGRDEGSVRHSMFLGSHSWCLEIICFLSEGSCMTSNLCRHLCLFYPLWIWNLKIGFLFFNLLLQTSITTPTIVHIISITVSDTLMFQIAHHIQTFNHYLDLRDPGLGYEPTMMFILGPKCIWSQSYRSKLPCFVRQSPQMPCVTAFHTKLSLHRHCCVFPPVLSVSRRTSSLQFLLLFHKCWPLISVLDI